MNKDEVFHNLALSTKDYLLDGHLLDALQALHALAAQHDYTALREQVETLQNDYQLMLDFTAQGGSDPLRVQQYERLTQRAITLLQELRRTHRLQGGTDLYARTFAGEQQPEGEGQTQREDALFDQLWTSAQFTPEQVEHYIALTGESESLAQYVLSALTLALLEYFDPGKLSVVLHYCEAENVDTRARALIALCTACELHSAFIQLHPHLAQQVQQICAAHVREIAFIQHFVCVTIESERIQQQIQQEIIPNIIRAHANRADAPQEPEGTITLSLNDPTLTKELRRQIGDSFYKMSRLMRDGMDLNIGTFLALKRFPFFHRLGHWLLPYDPGYVQSDYTEFISSLNLCDADKYSLTLFLNAAPLPQAEQMLQQLRSQVHIQEDPRSIQLSIRNALQSLTRTLRHSQWAGQWPEVLSVKTLFAKTPVLSDVLAADAHYLKRSIATYFKYGYFGHARTLLTMQQSLLGDRADILRRMAECDLELDDLDAATLHLQRALELAPDNEKLLFALQDVYGRARRWAQQADVLMRLEQLQPDDDEILTRLGYCLMRLAQWKDAQQRFYKMEFSGQRVELSMRAIAWCALMLGNLTSAHRYYDRLHAQPDAATWEDHLNLAHVLWIEGDVQSALSRYTQYARAYLQANPEATNALDPFVKDRDVLVQAGISPTDINLMHDLIVQSL